MRITLAQINPLVGDLKGNAKIIADACKKASLQKADLLLTPELSLWGYPPRDLLLNNLLLKEQVLILNELSKRLSYEKNDLVILLGIAEPALDKNLPNLFNAIAKVSKEGWNIVSRKNLLPSYDVFDEKRYFRSGQSAGIAKIKLKDKVFKLGITICEDLWVNEDIIGARLKGPDPIGMLVEKDIDFLINLSASPFSITKPDLRKKLAINAIRRLNCPMIYLNQVGANDELVFDGGSFVIDSSGKDILCLPNYKKEIQTWDTKSSKYHTPTKKISVNEKIFRALVLGVKDYSKKCGFKKVLIGLSGGIDSSLVTVISTAALGSKNVTTILMPSPWSSSSSITDSLLLAKRLGVESKTIPIDELMSNYDRALTQILKTKPFGIAAENLQSRIRGTLLMAIANQQGHLLLSTGNKSELAVGYCTLYGDMNGGLSVIGDLYKSDVFDLCAWLDSSDSLTTKESLDLPSQKEIIGLSIRQKAPSAELSPGQFDSDSLPEYSKLDPILKAIIEERVSIEDLVQQGFDRDLIKKIIKLIKRSEFKRRQAPPLIKISNQAFGTGWRVPIAAS